MLFYHGGGWVLGSVESHDATARALAVASRAAVLSVEYRLAPETPFPGPLDDCHDALLWAVDHADALGIDANRLAVAGDSAGGNLAAAVAIRARDAGGPKLAHQLLIYPVTDADFTNGSYADNGEGYFLTTRAMQWFWAHYVGDYADPHPHAAVLRLNDLTGLPPATVLVAQYDPLRDEGLAYAKALKAAGVAVETELAPGMIHGFFSMFEAVPDAMPYVARAVLVQPQADAADQRVAGLMAVLVVDRLEPVEIDEQQGQRIGRQIALCLQPVQPDEQFAPVG